jgi:outer membrane biosynthesis protein TonB
MTDSVAVADSGKTGYAPTEITKRTITYYQVDELNTPDASGAARPDAIVAPVAEGDRVSQRAQASGTEKASGMEKASGAKNPQAVLPHSPAAEGALLNAGLLNKRTSALPRPAYPVSWKRLKEPVTVTVEVVLDITGRVVEARAQGGPESLHEAAEVAARRAAFLPFYVAGRPVKARGLINYTFDFLP